MISQRSHDLSGIARDHDPVVSGIQVGCESRQVFIEGARGVIYIGTRERPPGEEDAWPQKFMMQIGLAMCYFVGMIGLKLKRVQFAYKYIYRLPLRVDCCAPDVKKIYTLNSSDNLGLFGQGSRTLKQNLKLRSDASNK